MTGNDHTVTLWEAAGVRNCTRWQESQGTVIGLAFSLDGQTVLTWGADGWARLWNVQGRYDRLAMVGYGCAGPEAPLNTLTSAMTASACQPSFATDAPMFGTNGVARRS